MTQNQINWYGLGLSDRHNRAMEEETHRNNVAVLEETARSNRERERVSRYSAKETKRSNRARERETKRSNRTSERETKRSNKAREKETHRSNQAQEKLRYLETSGNQAISARRIAVEANLRRSELNERIRSNLKDEYLRGVDSQIKRGNLRLAANNLSELIRHNRNDESIEKREQNMRFASNAINSLITAVKNSRDYKLASKKQKAEIDKLYQEISKLQIANTINLRTAGAQQDKAHIENIEKVINMFDKMANRVDKLFIPG